MWRVAALPFPHSTSCSPVVVRTKVHSLRASFLLAICVAAYGSESEVPDVSKAGASLAPSRFYHDFSAAGLQQVASASARPTFS